MERYSQYKDSENKLLGSIPAHWFSGRVKDLAKIKGGKDQKKVISENGKYPVYGSGGVFGKADSYLYDKVSVLLGRKGTIDKPLYVDEPFWTVDTMYFTEILKNTNPKFFYYRCTCIPFDLFQYGSAIPSMTQGDLININFAIPPLKEQTQIAKYLDAKTQTIDKKINFLLKKIEHYKAYRKTLINETVTKGLDKKVKLKDSGVECIGQIPEHWEVRRLKDLSRFINGYAFNSKEYVDKGIPIIRISNISNEINFYECKNVDSSYLKFAKDSLIRKNDILVAMTGATIGKNSIYKEKRQALLNQRVGIVRAKKTISNLFLYQIIKSQIFKDYIDLLCGGSAQENISKTQIENFYIQLPPISEQQQIAEFLDKKTTIIDDIVHNIESQIETLKELRKTLINDMVTGKLKVVD